MKQAVRTSAAESLPQEELARVASDPERKISIYLNPAHKDSELHDFADELERELELGRQKRRVDEQPSHRSELT